MNFRSIFAGLLQGLTNGAVQGLSSQTGPKVNWQSVGIIALFGGLVSLSQALSQHPAVAPLAVVSPQPALLPAPGTATQAH